MLDSLLPVKKIFSCLGNNYGVVFIMHNVVATNLYRNYLDDKDVDEILVN